jgi:hypothetical protein
MGWLVDIGGERVWDANVIQVVQDSTPLDPSDTFGGSGTVALDMEATPSAKALTGKSVELAHSRRGTLHAVAKAPSGDRRHVTVEAFGLAASFVCKRTALPHVGTLETLLQYWASLCGVTSGLVVDAAIADTSIIAPGWYGNVWEQMKDLGAAYDFEISPVGDEVVARPPRGFTATRFDEARFTWSLDESRIARTIEAWYYPVAEIADALVVGNAQNIPESNIEAGELIEFDVRVDASLSSVVQPVPVASVAYGERSASVYSILDQFDEPVSPEAWTAGGGSVTVTINQDTRSVHVRVVGSQNRMLAPYRMVGVAISGSEYSTLRVIGTGVSLDRRKYTLPVNEQATNAEEVGAEIDNYYLTSWGHAHLRMGATARRHGRVQQRIAGSADIILTPAGQEFGNIPGARMFEDYDVYRVRTATYGPIDVDYEAEADLTFEDVDAIVSGHTVEEWDALWAGRPVLEFDLRPLTPIPGEVTPPTGGYGSGVYGGPPVYGG